MRIAAAFRLDGGLGGSVRALRDEVTGTFDPGFECGELLLRERQSRHELHEIGHFHFDEVAQLILGNRYGLFMDAIPERRIVLVERFEEPRSVRHAKEEGQSFGALADHGTNPLTVLQGSGLCLVRLRSVDAVKQPADTDGLIVTPRMKEIMGPAQVIQQGAAAVKVLVGVQIEQQVEVFLVNHVPCNPEADGKLP